MKPTILIALSRRETQEAVADLLRQSKEPELSVHALEDPFALVETAKSLRPDLLILSCNVCSPPLVEMLRVSCDLEESRFVLYCDTITDRLLAERCDARISPEESPKELLELVTALLTEEVKTETEELTPREREVVTGIVKGKTNKEIADELFISPNTVTTHRRNIVRKLDIHSAAGLTVYAIMNNLVSLRDIDV